MAMNGLIRGTLFVMLILCEEIIGQEQDMENEYELVELGLIQLKEVKQNEIIEYPIKQDTSIDVWNVVLAIKTIQFSSLCKSDVNYSFEMKLQSILTQSFVIQISEFSCLDEAEIQWYLLRNSNAKLPLYQKNIPLVRTKKLKQTYEFQGTNISVVPLITGFSIPAHTTLELEVLRQTHQLIKLVQETNIIVSSQNEQSIKQMDSLSLSISFLMLNRQMLTCSQDKSHPKMTHVIQSILRFDSDATLNQADYLCIFNKYEAPGKETKTPLMHGTMIFSKGILSKFSSADLSSNSKQTNNENDNFWEFFLEATLILLLIGALAYIILKLKRLTLSSQSVYHTQLQEI